MVAYCSKKLQLLTTTLQEAFDRFELIAQLRLLSDKVKSWTNCSKFKVIDFQVQIPQMMYCNFDLKYIFQE